MCVCLWGEAEMSFFLSGRIPWLAQIGVWGWAPGVWYWVIGVVLRSLLFGLDYFDRCPDTSLDAICWVNILPSNRFV